MSNVTVEFDDQRRRTGLVRQILTSVFVGIPLTAGLLVAVAAYCAFEYARYALLPMEPQRVDFQDSTQAPFETSPAEESFTASLSNFAAIHGATAQVGPTGVIHVTKLATEEEMQKAV